jgi:hypothetical protein
MTTNYHTPHAVAAPVTAAEFNAKLGELDAGLTAIASASLAEGASTLDAQALAGQAVVPVADTTGFRVGDPVMVGNIGSGTTETKVIASISAGVSLTMTTNLANTHSIGEAVTRSPAEVVHARGAHPLLGTRIAAIESEVNDAHTGHASLGAKIRAQWIDPLEYGITFDGVTDDTAAWNSLFDGIRDNTESRRRVVCPRGTSKITGVINVTCNEIVVEGQGNKLTIIKQFTGNTPIFLWDDETVGSANAVFRRMRLTWNTAPTTATTQQYGVQFRATPAATGGLGWGYYLNIFEDLEIEGAYVGIGAYIVSGSCPVWSSVFRDITLWSTIHSAFSFPVGSSGGQPHLRFERINVLNYQGRIHGDFNQANDHVALFVEACTGLTVDQFNVEDWTHNVWYVGGQSAILSGLRVERWVGAAANPAICVISGPGHVINGMSLESLTLNHTGVLRLVRVESAGSSVAINGLYAAVAAGAGSSAAIDGADGTFATVNAISVGSPIAQYFASGFGPGVYCRVSVNGLPPEVDALPAASAAYRKRMFTIIGGAGVADVTYRCRKNAANAYEWYAI